MTRTKLATVLLLLICCGAALHARTPADRFCRIAAVATGDLNKDGLADSAVVVQDTGSDKAPYRLDLYFALAGGSYRHVLRCADCIDPRYPEGRDGWATGNDFDTISIDGGVLTIGVQLLRGHYEHKFRYQGNGFKLIGFTQSASDGIGKMESIDFNLSTGRRNVVIESYETNQVLSKTSKIIKIRPLPDLATFRPQDNEYY